MENTPFATIAQMEAFWRPLTQDETTRAEYLLQISSERLRVIASDSGIDIDKKVSESGSYAAVVQWVVMESVKRALQTPVDTLPVDTYSQTAGPYSENYKYTNPSGDLWFKKKELAELGIDGVQKIDTITPKTRRNIYGE